MFKTTQTHIINRVILSFSILFTLVFVQTLHAQNNAAFSYSSKQKIKEPSWMNIIPDKILLNKISVPGTHDSISYSKKGHKLIAAVETQKLSLKDQLNSGIRALDIRVKLTKGGDFALHHGPFYLNRNFKDILKVTTKFLGKNKSEFILMRISYEGDIPKGKKGDLKPRLNKYLETKEFAPFIFKNNDSELKNPTIGKMRGKLVIMRKHDWIDSTYGIKYPTYTPPYGQDEFEMFDDVFAEGMYKKWKAVRKSLGWVNGNSGNPPVSINYLSATGITGKLKELIPGVEETAVIPEAKILRVPWKIASGQIIPTDSQKVYAGVDVPKGKSWPDFPRKSCVVGIGTCIFIEGINELTKNYINKKAKSHVGIIMADYPGPGLIRSIINLNKFYDFGYNKNRTMADVNGDGKADFCRAVGDGKSKYYRCNLSNGHGLDKSINIKESGYLDRFYQFVDINGDGRDDFCRVIGDDPNTKIKCTFLNKTTKSGPDFTIFNRKLTKDNSIKQFIDINNDGKADFCRGIHGGFKCYIYDAKKNSFYDGSKFLFKEQKIDAGYASFRNFAVIYKDEPLPRFCREIGNKGSTWISCRKLVRSNKTFQGPYSRLKILVAAQKGNKGYPIEATFKGDLGYKENRQIIDIDNDGRAEYCREVGNRKRNDKSYMLCTGRKKMTFSGDIGYLDSFRQFADFNGDKQLDFIREIGNRPLSKIGVTLIKNRVVSKQTQQYTTP